MNREVIIGLDIGTSSLKMTIADFESGEIINNRRNGYSMNEIRPGVIPVSIYEDAVVRTIRSASERYLIKGMGISTQMYSFCEDTEEGRIVYQWNSLWDRRREKDEYLKAQMKKSGCPLDTLFPAYKLSTVEDEKRISFVPYGLKEHIIDFLTGELVTDYSTASASGMFDIKNRKWNEGFISSLGFSNCLTPRVLNHNRIIGYVKEDITGQVQDKTALVPALGDGISASYACSNLSKICGNLGTSMAVRTVSKKENEECRSLLWTFALDEERYITGGISSNSCSVFHWADRLGIKSDKGIQQTGDVMFFPWIHGERTPYWSSDIKGTFAGLGIDIDKSMMEGAVLKSVAFTFAAIVEELERYIDYDDVLVLGGGGAHCKGLVEIISGVVPVKLGFLNEYDFLASYGAAMSAAEALGVELKNVLHYKEIFEPTNCFKNEYKKWSQTAKQLIKLYEHHL